MVHQKADYSGTGLELWDVAIKAKAVETFDGKGDMFIEKRFDGGQRLGLSFHTGLLTRKLTPSAPARIALKMECRLLAQTNPSNEAPPQTGQICASATDFPEELVGLRRSFIGILENGLLT